MTHFVILAVPRTGSNLLCTLLNSHPEILCHHEVFNPQGIFTWLTHRHASTDLGSVVERDRDPVAFLDRVWGTRSQHTCVGFKWTRGQNQAVLQHVVEDPEVKKIVLRRRDQLKTYVSEKIALKTQQWEVYREQELVMPRPKITVNAADLYAHLAVNRRFYEQLERALGRSSQPCLPVDYESLFALDEHRRLLDYLGINGYDYPLQAASVKQNSVDLRDLIENYEELAAKLDDCQLEGELHDRGI